MLRLAGLVAAVAIAIVIAVPAGAHTEVQSAEPGPADEVSGPVDEVVLTFLDPIRLDATIEVSGPSGAVDATSVATLDDSERVLRIGIEPVEETGDYIVRYEFTALDGDHQVESYRFRIVESDAGLPVGAVAAVGLVIAAVAVALWRRRSS